MNSDPECSFFYIRESIDEYGEFLNKLLLCDVDLKAKDPYNIYDPNSNGAYILHKTKRDILKNNPDAKIGLFGKSIRNENRAIYLCKKSIAKNDPYEIPDALVLHPDEDILKVGEIKEYGDLDFIVTNLIGSDLDECKKILDSYADNKIDSAKFVLATDSLNYIEKRLGKLIENDYLESLINLSTHYILILNSNKNPEKQGKFLFIDKSDILEEKGYKERYQRDIYENNQFDLFNTHISMKLSEFDKKKMDDIIEIYDRFEDGDDSILISNDDFDTETLELLLI